VTTSPGRLLASGRDSDIFEFGAGTVLRRARNGRSMEYEAAVMEYARSHGYPVPVVHELRAGGSELVLDRIDGPHLIDAIGSAPWRIKPMAHVLADLHEQLHAIPAPADVPAITDDGDALLHLDLHPLNVIMSSNGPVVIDWPNSGRGHWASDVADTWLVLSAAAVPGNGLRTRVISRMRSVFVNAFIARFDRDEVCAHLRAAADRRARDRNMTAPELARMRALVQANAGGAA
jgi:tRNA A-37 threonylcarbamoyl transferase component Bud32